MDRQAEHLLLLLLIISNYNRVLHFGTKQKFSNEIVIHIVRNILQQLTEDEHFKTEMIASKGSMSNDWTTATRK
jgi:hypothetical protein